MSPLLTRRPPAQRTQRTGLVLQAAALVLSYPQAELLDRLDVIEAALSDTPAAEQFAPVIAHLRRPPSTGTADEPGSHLARLQAFHVQ